ncbi:MAG: FAD-dependent oxidoreductase [Thermoanaerobaculia bacterium]|nr:FAD-dependent oxidoreductase [Thermoanaerobaculia bacterium]
MTRHVEVDVAVVGAGPGGLAAIEALTRDRSPHSSTTHPGTIALIDDAPIVGGQIWRARDSRPARETDSYLDLLQHDQVDHLQETLIVDAASGSGESPVLFAVGPTGPVRIVARAIVLATGAMERFLPFPGWTLPGVVGAGGLQALIKGGFDVAGRRLVIAGSGPLLLAVADLARRCGAQVLCLTEQAERHSLLPFARAILVRPGKLWQGLGLGRRLLPVRKRFGTWPIRAVGDERLEHVVLRSSDGRESTVECDLLACGFGLVPRLSLPRLLGCQVEAVGDGALRVVVDDRQRTSVPGVYAIGEATGVGGVDKALVEGRVAGLDAAGKGVDARLMASRDRERRFADALEASFSLRDELRELPTSDTLVCRCEDVPWTELAAARCARDAKLNTRCGMGPCQARVCGPALAFLKGWVPESPRPPLFPTDLQTLTDLYQTETFSEQSPPSNQKVDRAAPV